MAFSKGDKVWSNCEIKGGFFKTNVKARTKGVVTKTSMFSSDVDVSFESNGMGYPAVELTGVNEKHLDKRY